MKAQQTIISLFLLTIALLGCAPQPGAQPSWVNEPHRDYPPDQFLVGVATGEDCDDAVDLAIARIAQQIEVRVNASEQRRSLYDAVNALERTDSTSLQTEVHLITDATLLGVEIVESRSLASGACSALAILDIDRSIALYDEAIRRHDDSINTLIRRADSAGSVWLEYLDVSQALREAVEHDVLAVTRSVLATRSARGGAPTTMTAPTLVSRYQALHDSISLSVVPSGECPEAFVRQSESTLLKLGLPIERDHPGAIQLRIGWRPEAQQTYDPRWWSCRWSLGVTLYDTQHGDTIARNDPVGDTAYGPSREAAIDEALSQAVLVIDEAVQAVVRRPGAFSH